MKKFFYHSVKIAISTAPYLFHICQVKDVEPLQADNQIFSLGVPVLGICYGLHILNDAHGGTVERKPIREDGQFEIQIDTSCPLFEGLSSNQVW